jgi:DNA-binding transcriptional LysR family regulator
MELTPLRYFAEIASRGHVTKAARALGVTQPALSAMLRKLEAHVGATLVHRTGKGVELTEAGRVFLRHAQAALREADEGRRAVRELLGLERGVVRVGGGATATTYLIPPVVGTLRRAHPGLRFAVREAGSSAVAQAVASGELDLGIVTLPITIPEGDVLERTPLVTDELRLIAPVRGAPFAPPAGDDAGTFAFKDLAGVPIVGFEAGSAIREIIDNAAAKAGVTLDYVMELRSIEGIKEMVAAGVGVGFVSRFALVVPDARVVGRTPRGARLSRTLAMITRRGRLASPATSAFAGALTAHLRSGSRSR